MHGGGVLPLGARVRAARRAHAQEGSPAKEDGGILDAPFRSWQHSPGSEDPNSLRTLPPLPSPHIFMPSTHTATGRGALRLREHVRHRVEPAAPRDRRAGLAAVHRTGQGSARRHVGKLPGGAADSQWAAGPFGQRLQAPHDVYDDNAHRPWADAPGAEELRKVDRDDAKGNPSTACDARLLCFSPLPTLSRPLTDPPLLSSPKVDRNKAKTDMGSWIADYFDDAGYINWETQSPIFKAMLMSAFPPIDALDDVKPDYGTMPIDQWEEQLTKVLAVMDSHLASEQRRVKPIGGVGQIFTWIKKR